MILRLLSRSLRRALRHPGLIVGTYLIAALPALLTSLPFLLGLWSEAGGRQRAERMGEFDLIVEFLTLDSGSSIFGLSCLLFLVALAITAVVRLLFSAGAIESLFERNVERGRPFFRGIARHSGRHAVAGLWVGIVGGLLVLGAMISVPLVTDWGIAQQDDRYQAFGLLAVAALVFAIFMVGYWIFDLARIALAERSRGSALRSLLAAARQILVSPLRIGLPLLITTGLPLGLLWITILWAGHAPLTSGVDLLIAWLGQQMLFLLVAACRIWRWCLGIELYLGLGSPAWPIKRGQLRVRPDLYRTGAPASPLPAAPDTSS